MNLPDLFSTKSFRVKNKETGQEYDAVRVEGKITKLILSCSDRPVLKEVERDLVEPGTKRHLGKVKDYAKCFDFTGEADSSSHGGAISALAGDYILKDGDAYFVVPDIDRRTRRPIFDMRYAKV